MLEFLRRWFSPRTPTPMSLAQYIVMVAREELALHVRESSKNQGEHIAKYWTATSYPNGYVNREPWCAAFVCWLVNIASKRMFGSSFPFALPRSAAVANWPTWALLQRGWKCVTGPVYPGDIICWDFNGVDAAGGTHMGVAVSYESPEGVYDTIEGNTSADGSRDGDGVYERHTRDRKHILAIIRYVGK